MAGRRPGSASTAGPIRVFILDDHELLRRGLRGLLEAAEGIEVVGESGSAEEGRRRILALRPDVALLDVRLPDGSGVDVCRWVRSRDESIRVLMLTTFDDEDARVAAAVAGAAGFVLKQVHGEQLVRTIRAVVTGPPPGGQATGPPQPPRLTADPGLDALTGQERRILDLIVEGMTNRQIGERLGVTDKTVRNHVTNLLAKLSLDRRTQAAVYAVRHQPDEPRRP